MGAKTCMLVYSHGIPREILGAKPVLDREATRAFAKKLFPADTLEPLADSDLSNTFPPRNELIIGCFPGLVIAMAKEFALDRPSKLPGRFVSELAAPGQTVYLHAMHSVVDWFAYAVWREGKLQRSLSLTPEKGMQEDTGERLPFELPYWAGKYPAIDAGDEEAGEEPYPLVFHPLDLGEAALLEFFGYQIEGAAVECALEPHDVPLMRFKRSKSWLKRLLG